MLVRVGRNFVSCWDRNGRPRLRHSWDKDGICVFCDKPKMAGPDRASVLRQKLWWIDRRAVASATIVARRAVRRMEKGLEP